jgi:NAD(P)-dependent dehydrogenase (short-subunit alcohol dehydrogenase family)
VTKTAVVAGAGGALGVELCRALRLREWHVVGAGRDAARLRAELGDSVDEVIEVELTSPASVQRAFQTIERVDALVYNAGRIDLSPLSETTPEVFEESFRVNAFGAFLCARACAAPMIGRGQGSMIFVGATASVRGGARSHAFAAAKHALRGLSASLAKELGPSGVHVAHLVIDGKIWGARTRERFPAAREDQCLAPAAVATTVCALIEQAPSAWTFELDLRPNLERWS